MEEYCKKPERIRVWAFFFRLRNGHTEDHTTGGPESFHSLAKKKFLKNTLAARLDASVDGFIAHEQYQYLSILRAQRHPSASQLKRKDWRRTILLEVKKGKYDCTITLVSATNIQDVRVGDDLAIYMAVYLVTSRTNKQDSHTVIFCKRCRCPLQIAVMCEHEYTCNCLATRKVCFHIGLVHVNRARVHVASILHMQRGGTLPVIASSSSSS